MVATPLVTLVYTLPWGLVVAIGFVSDKNKNKLGYAYDFISGLNFLLNFQTKAPPRIAIQTTKAIQMP